MSAEIIQLPSRPLALTVPSSSTGGFREGTPKDLIDRLQFFFGEVGDPLQPSHHPLIRNVEFRVPKAEPHHHP